MPNQFSVQIHADGVAEVVLDRPPVNALNSLGWFSLAAQITALGQDPDVRVIVIRAEDAGSAPASTSRNSTPTAT